MRMKSYHIMKILLIEDNQRLSDQLKAQLAKQYVMDMVDTGEKALLRVKQLNYDVIILDLGLPDMDGHEVCRVMRKEGVASPVIVLTGTDDIATRVELLEGGADDYLAKPFHIDELRARIHALSRRRQSMSETMQLSHQDLVIDTLSRQVYRAGRHIPLRRKEYDILEYLVANKGRILTRQMIINHVWETEHRVSWRSTVDVHIKHLRDKIDRPFPTKIIKTSYGLGYRVDTPRVGKKRKGKT